MNVSASNVAIVRAPHSCSSVDMRELRGAAGVDPAGEHDDEHGLDELRLLVDGS